MRPEASPRPIILDMPYRKRHERNRERKRIAKEAETRAGELLAGLRADRGLSRDEVVPDAALVSEAVGYLPPGSPLVERYLAARLDGAGNGEGERDELVGALLMSRNRRWHAREAKVDAMNDEAKEARNRITREAPRKRLP